MLKNFETKKTSLQTTARKHAGMAETWRGCSFQTRTTATGDDCDDTQQRWNNKTENTPHVFLSMNLEIFCNYQTVNTTRISAWNILSDHQSTRLEQ